MCMLLSLHLVIPARDLCRHAQQADTVWIAPAQEIALWSLLSRLPYDGADGNPPAGDTLVACPANSSSLPGSAAQSGCHCAAGFGTTDGGQTCTRVLLVHSSRCQVVCRAFLTIQAAWDATAPVAVCVFPTTGAIPTRNS
jgi:hypothetical protein